MRQGLCSFSCSYFHRRLSGLFPPVSMSESDGEDGDLDRRLTKLEATVHDEVYTSQVMWKSIRRIIIGLKDSVFRTDMMRATDYHALSNLHSQVHRILLQQERLQEASMMNARTRELQDITMMLVNLMDKVDSLIDRRAVANLESESDDDIKKITVTIRTMHSHDKSLAAKKKGKGKVKIPTPKQPFLSKKVGF